MIKVSYFISRLPSMSEQDFHDYWRNSHAALIKRHAATFGIARYVQVHVTDDPRNRPSQTFPHRYDGIAELWFNSQEDVERWFVNSTPESRAAGKEIRDDERRFIDRGNSPLLVGEEEPIIP